MFAIYASFVGVIAAMWVFYTCAMRLEAFALKKGKTGKCWIRFVGELAAETGMDVSECENLRELKAVLLSLEDWEIGCDKDLIVFVRQGRKNRPGHISMFKFGGSLGISMHAIRQGYEDDKLDWRFGATVVGAITALTGNFWTLVDHVKAVYTAPKTSLELANARWASWQAESGNVEFYTHAVKADSYDEKTHALSTFTHVAKTEVDIVAYIAAASDAAAGSMALDIVTHMLYPKTTKGNFIACYTFAGSTTPGMRGGRYLFMHFPPSVNKAVLTSAVQKGMRSMVSTIYAARATRPQFLTPLVRALIEWRLCGGQTASGEAKIDYAYQYAWRDTLTVQEAQALREDISAIIGAMDTAGKANKGKAQGSRVKAVRPTLKFFNGLDGV